MTTHLYRKDSTTQTECGATGAATLSLDRTTCHRCIERRNRDKRLTAPPASAYPPRYDRRDPFQRI